MKLIVAGCGDAFGSGGRLQTCFHVEASGEAFLIDCGATALIGMRRLDLDPNGVRTIYVSHLHGDHFAGIVWWLMHANYVSRRTAPLTIAGPRGIEQRVMAAAEILFPGSSTVTRRYALDFVELTAGGSAVVGGQRVAAYEVSHPSGAPSLALRVEAEGKTLAFSGDTEWTESLVPCATGADLFVCECYAYARQVRYHLDWRALEANLPRLGARRVLITHMHEDMLANREHLGSAEVVLAEDGLVLEI